MSSDGFCAILVDWSASSFVWLEGGEAKMRLPTAVMILTIPMSTPAVGQSFEGKQSDVCSPDIIDCPAVANELVRLVETYGFKCNSISFINKWVFSRGFSIQCNHHAYEYDVKDRGGTWVVSYVE